MYLLKIKTIFAKKVSIWMLWFITEKMQIHSTNSSSYLRTSVCSVTSKKLPKFDCSRKMKDFDIVTKIAKNVGI